MVQHTTTLSRLNLVRDVGNNLASIIPTRRATELWRKSSCREMVDEFNAILPLNWFLGAAITGRCVRQCFVAEIAVTPPDRKCVSANACVANSSTARRMV